MQIGSGAPQGDHGRAAIIVRQDVSGGYFCASHAHGAVLTHAHSVTVSTSHMSIEQGKVFNESIFLMYGFQLIKKGFEFLEIGQMEGRISFIGLFQKVCVKIAYTDQA